jgi:hypothetical protein
MNPATPMLANRLIRSFVVALTAWSAAASAVAGAVPTWRCEDGRPCPLTAGRMPAHEQSAKGRLCEKHGAAAPAENSEKHACCKAKAAADRSPSSGPTPATVAPPMRCVLVSAGVTTYVKPRAADETRLDPRWASAFPPDLTPPTSPATAPAIELWGKSDFGVGSPAQQSATQCRGPRAPPQA